MKPLDGLERPCEGRRAPRGPGRAAGGARAGRRRLALLLLWLLPAIWSSNYLIARSAGPHVPPHVLAFGRWGIVCALLLAFNARAIAAHPRRLLAEWRQLLALGALGMWICGAWVYIAGHTTSTTNLSLIYAAAPVGIALAGQRLLGERFGGAQRLAMLLSLAGVVFVVLHGEPASLLAVRFVAGDLWILAATLSWVGYSVLQQYWKTKLSATERLCSMAAGGLLLMLPFVAWELATMARPLDAAAWQLIVLAALLPGLLSYLCYDFLQRELGVARAGLVLYLAPIYAAALAWWLLGEPPQWYHGVGALLILPSIHIATRRA
ncbi:MAG: DMT family transporter [Burkholderiales bacterium]|nr:DMT family transporter [Burkholderiales bacterium]